ncbi:hypothetical protein [Streptomyces zaomyceticus]|uniref:hypothetical protein n=1 Tax=Streptomyces zaomyceticus TaxID=68286 RepID=UPI0034495234
MSDKPNTLTDPEAITFDGVVSFAIVQHDRPKPGQALSTYVDITPDEVEAFAVKLIVAAHAARNG